MNTHNIRLVQESFAKVAPIAETAAELFYHRLFELDGNLRHLFHSDIRHKAAGPAADAHGRHRSSPFG